MSEKDTYIFKLYVVENTAKSQALVASLKMIFDKALKKNYRLEVIDIITNPELAINSKVLATPTLVLEFPTPSKRLVGNVSNKESVLIGLNLLNL